MEIDPFSADRYPYTFTWMGLAPPRVEAFCWLTVAGKISTTDILRRRGLISKVHFKLALLLREGDRSQ